MTLATFDRARVAARRRPLDKLEHSLVRLAVAHRGTLGLASWTGQDAGRYEALRYALSFAKLTEVEGRDGVVLDIDGPMQAFAVQLRADLEPRLLDAKRLDEAFAIADAVVRRTRDARSALFATLPVDRDAFEAEVTTRQLVIASGGGGGAGYVYPGAYEQIDKLGLTPRLLVGTSIGALMGMFRARRERFDLAALVSAARNLAWGRVFRPLHREHRYGLPATLHLHLHDALGSLFEVDGRTMRMHEAEIPVYTIATGITVDALKHDLATYERMFDDAFDTRGVVGSTKTAIRTFEIVREFLGRRDALREIVIGREPGTEGFDILDAAGFSAAIPAVIHYDVLRQDPGMHRILDDLYAAHGITRLGEGGMVSNVPARVAWETAASGHLGPRRNPFVLALDCFAPTYTRPGWFPFQQLVRQANVTADRAFSDLYVPFPTTLSPLNLVPPLNECMDAIEWGRAAIAPELPFLAASMTPIPVLEDA